MEKLAYRVFDVDAEEPSETLAMAMTETDAIRLAKQAADHYEAARACGEIMVQSIPIGELKYPHPPDMPHKIVFAVEFGV